MVYYKYSDYLRKRYGEKVYKLPVNLPLTCPNRDGTKGYGGCIFCGEVGAGLEALPDFLPIQKQLAINSAYIGKKYNARKYIAYFQNFTNTYQSPERFYTCLSEAAAFPGVVMISVSTRPDCISPLHIKAAQAIKDDYGTDVQFELGLQTSNNRSLELLNRRHTAEDFSLAASAIKQGGLMLGAHVILGLFCDTKEDVLNTAALLNKAEADTVKCHSLFVLKDTKLAKMLSNNEITLKSMDEFREEVILFLEHLNENIAVERLLGRGPKKDTLFENWGRSWRYVYNEIIKTMEKDKRTQGSFGKLT